MNKIELIKAEIDRLEELNEEQFKRGVISIDILTARGGLLLRLEDFIDSLPEEQPSEDLEKAAEKYLNFIAQSDVQRIYSKHDFKAGAEWQKEQMMKGAVDADVELILHDKTGDIRLHTDYLPNELGVKYSDKVKIIIVKED